MILLLSSFLFSLLLKSGNKQISTNWQKREKKTIYRKQITREKKLYCMRVCMCASVDVDLCNGFEHLVYWYFDLKIHTNATTHPLRMYMHKFLAFFSAYVPHCKLTVFTNECSISLCCMHSIYGLTQFQFVVVLHKHLKIPHLPYKIP